MSCNTGTPASATADFILNLTPTFNDAVKAEFDAMKKNGADLNKAATDGRDAITTQKAEYDSLLADFSGQIDEFIQSLNTQQDNSEKVSDRTPTAKIIALVIAIGILVLMILFLLLMVCSLKGKCHNCSTFL